MKTALCSTCSRKIIWGTNKDTGKNIPIDMVAPVFSVFEEEDGTVTLVNLKKSAGVSHFATCPDAGHHSKVAKDMRESAAGW